MIQYFTALRENILDLWDEKFFVNDITRQNFLFITTYLINKPEYIEHVMLTNQANYEKSEVFKRIFRPLMGEGLLVSDGNHWRRQRKFAAPAFQHRRIEHFVDTMATSASTALGRWENLGPQFDIGVEMMRITVDIIARTMFSSDVTSHLGRIGELMNVLNSGKPNLFDVFGLPDWLPRHRPDTYVKAVEEFEALIAEALAPRRAGDVERGDLLSMLLSARDPETGEGMNDRQLRDEIVTIFAAGHETTAVALTWTSYLLARNPSVQAKVLAEVDSVLEGRAPSFADLSNLVFTRMVFDEALRLYPPAYLIQRTALSDDEIGGVKIAAGSIINISPYLTQRNPNLWPDPDRFDPERFDPANPVKRHRFAHLPFGAGPRICLGMQFAIAEALVILASIAQRYSLSLAHDDPAEPVALMSLRPKKPVLVRAEPRLHDLANGPSRPDWSLAQ